MYVFQYVTTTEDKYLEMDPMHQENEDPMETLKREIKDLKEKLGTIDRDNTQSVDSIAENTKRISDVLCRISDKKIDITNYRYNPIFDLLKVEQLTRIEIPLDVLNQLISVGFDLNAASWLPVPKACLNIAAQNHHYNAARLLIQHGAKGASGTYNIDQTDKHVNGTCIIEPVITVLASQPDAPLDLFDLLATPQNLNDSSNIGRLPLHEAVLYGHTAIALHLIKLGARVDQKWGKLSVLPVEYYFLHVESNIKRFNTDDKLLMSLLPSRMHGVEVLRFISQILDGEQDKNDIGVLEVIHQLLQRLHFDKPLVLDIKTRLGCFIINDNVDASSPYLTHSPLFLYLFSWILVELQFDLASTPSEIGDDWEQTEINQVLWSYSHAAGDIWKKYHQQSRVKSLQRLCILCTRNSMSSFDDESFVSLPVPPYLRKLLTYRDVSEKIFEEWCRAPDMSLYM